jgi:hypothetical protein
VRPDILNRIERKEIPALFETEVEEILPEKLKLVKAGGERFEIANDFVLALTGSGQPAEHRRIVANRRARFDRPCRQQARPDVSAPELSE